MKRNADRLVLSILVSLGLYPALCPAEPPLLQVAPGSTTTARKPISRVPYYSGSPATAPAVRQTTASQPRIEPVPVPDDPADDAAKKKEILPLPADEAGANAPDSEGPLDNTPESVVPLRNPPVVPPPALEQTDLPLAINLATALQLSDARPLIVAAAQSSAWVAEAELQRAKVLWVPTFNAGTDYIRHDGFGPDFNRGLNTPQRPLSQNVNFLYSGIGLIQNVAMTDAIFQPLAARQVLNARRWNIQAAKNDALLATANAYFSVHEFRGQYAGALDAVRRGKMLVNRITFLSEDLVPRVEIDRAQRMLAELQQDAATARQMWRVASADLTQVLRLDPRVVVVPQEHDHLQVTLIDPARPLDELIPMALTHRPELASQQELVRSVAQRIRQEKGRMLMPSLMLNGFQTPNELIQFGAQGMGQGRNLNLFSLRDDISPQAMWQFEGMGLGNMARIKEQRGEQSRSIVEQFRIQDGVAADVTRAQARMQAAAVRVVQADRSLRAAIITFEGNYEGLSQTKRFANMLVQVFRPQEAVVALEQLMISYTHYFGTVAEYNRAQFEMFHALGYPAREIAALRTPGNAVPIDGSRPSYLPPVGEGPPPALR